VPQVADGMLHEAGFHALGTNRALRGLPAPRLSGCLILNGMPGSGKTTATRLIAGLSPRAALLRSEYVAELVVSGRVWALGKPRSEARRQQLLAWQTALSAALPS
jgi:ABC-type multidrug transport system ATPase subunit